jgi:hypothetical protein
MNAFEQIIALLLEQDGYWTITDYKVNIPKEKKAALGKPSMPRPEIDILAYKANDNTLIWIECKSFLDSAGVHIDSFTNGKNPGYERYKVFNYPEYRRVVTNVLIEQTLQKGLIQPDPIVKYGLVTGKIYSESNREKLRQLFNEQGWLLFDDLWVKDRLSRIAKIGYEDNMAVIVAKLFSGK